jgi:hypothetical protein
LKSGQFLRGKIDGIQKNFESANLDKILPSDKLIDLADYAIIGEHQRFFKKENVLTKTVITPAENSDGRKGGVVNHTVLYKWDQKLIKDSAAYVFDTETFIAEIREGKRSFKMPPTPTYPEDTDFAIIDSPPEILWEAT